MLTLLAVIFLVVPLVLIMFGLVIDRFSGSQLDFEMELLDARLAVESQKQEHLVVYNEVATA
jgi:hypothetical protein